MRSYAIGALALFSVAIFAGCMDFGLDERAYRCEEDPSVCGEGWFCNAEGFCERGDGPTVGADAGFEDPEPAVCGENGEDEVCDDENPCTENECTEDGECEHEPLPDNTPCGEGCLCEDGEPVDLTDCPEEQCPSGHECCDDGTCRPNC